MSIEPNDSPKFINKQQKIAANFDEKTFDEYADLYEKMFMAPYRQYLEIPTLEGLLGDLSGLKVLDFGCGPGFLSRWLHSKGAESVVGYDISEGMLDYAKFKEKQQPQGISYLSALDDSLTGEFDLVLAVYVMPYAPDKEKLLSMSQAMARLLKSGGRLITLPIHPDFHSDPEYYRPYGLRLLEKEPRTDGSIVNLHICQPPYNVNIDAYYWSAETLMATLERAGFHSLSWRQLQLPINEPSSGVSLSDYLHVPHAAIIDGIKGGGTVDNQGRG
ncbi:class I SAM-dependent methyltransferase [Yersinia kristensenii]|uniref:Biotin synthesis protein bioC n=1 Tax=Yersinia kristensenii TaxID=28152 RepID=A0A0T9M1Z4_YERKR|nr:class I SAM-dependent methyltransferase [Yersinia kristensenii]PJG63781.1 class I SAM-dependent methyltransferase [Yersinia kristensenii]CNF51759.1 biotin synthesis protein bioC [Yersinia kristensenii]